MQDRVVAVRRPWPGKPQQALDVLDQGIDKDDSARELHGVPSRYAPNPDHPCCLAQPQCFSPSMTLPTFPAQPTLSRSNGTSPPKMTLLPVDLRSSSQHSSSGSAPRDSHQEYHLYCIFDGHRGAAASRFCSHSVVGMVESHLPPLRQGSAAAEATGRAGEWEGELLAALLKTVVDLQRQFGATGSKGGCTATIVLQVRRGEGPRAAGVA